MGYEFNMEVSFIEPCHQVLFFYLRNFLLAFLAVLLLGFFLWGEPVVGV